MTAYEAVPAASALSRTTYPGRGIITGCSQDGQAVIAYFIMGRSDNSRNRVFREKPEGDVFTAAFDESRVEDPRLIIYNAVRRVGHHLVVTNGDQTDTICDYLTAGKSFEASLCTRCFEPDAPNFTPRISALVTFQDGGFSVQQSILKSADAAGSDCSRYFFSFGRLLPGTGRFLHTYNGDGSPIPSFTGEPELIAVSGDIDAFTDAVWTSLNEANKISLYVRYTDPISGRFDSRLINKNQ